MLKIFFFSFLCRKKTISRNYVSFKVMVDRSTRNLLEQYICFSLRISQSDTSSAELLIGLNKNITIVAIYNTRWAQHFLIYWQHTLCLPALTCKRRQFIAQLCGFIYKDWARWNSVSNLKLNIGISSYLLGNASNKHTNIVFKLIY